MTESRLVGYVRKKDRTIKVTLDVMAFTQSEKYETKDGRSYASFVINADKVRELLDGEREVTSLCQIVEE